MSRRLVLHRPWGALLRSSGTAKRGVRWNSDVSKPASEGTTEEDKALVKEEFPKVLTRSEHIKRLSKYYSPKMLKSIVATEQIVTPEIWERRQQQIVPFAISYRDDLSKRDKFFDIGVHAWEDFNKAYQPVPEMTDEVEKIPSASNSLEVIRQDLHTYKGMTTEYLQTLVSRPVVKKFVSNVTRLGKVRSSYCLVVVGDQNGLLGVGEATAREGMRVAMEKARWRAIKKMEYIPRLENRTIYSSLEGHYHAVDFKFWPRPAGFGLRVNHLVHAVAVCAGIKDLAGKVLGSRNKMNTVKGTIELLRKQVLPEDIARARGKKVMDVRKTYYSRRQHAPN